MTTLGPSLPAAAFDNGGGTKTWTSPGNATATDGVFATMVTTTQTPNEIAFNQFGSWTSSTISAGATINGIQIDIKGKQSAAGAFSDIGVAVVGASGTFSANLALNSSSTFTTTNAVVTYGGPANLLSPSATWVSTDFDSTFTLYFDIGRNTTTSRTFSLDSVTVTVTYTVGGTNWALTGTITGASAISGTAAMSLALAGTVSSASAVSGTMRLALALAGTVTNASAIAGTAKLNSGLISTITGASAISGTSVLNCGVIGTITGLSSIAGSINMAYPLNGSVTGASAVAGTLFKNQPITGTITAASAISGTAGLLLPLASTISAVSDLTGTLLRTFGISALITALSELTGTAVLALANVATVGNASSVSGTLGMNLGLTGSISNTSNVSGTLSVLASNRSPGILGDSNLCDLPP